MINDKYMELVDPSCKQAYLDYKDGKDTIEAYGSHQPFLINLLNTITEGDVLEFGVGNQSTPIMHTICEHQGRNLLSLEYSKEWINRFDYLRSEKHEIKNFALNDLYTLRKRHFAIALIDGEPRILRQALIHLLKNNVDYFLVHDTQELLFSEEYINSRSDCVFYDYDFSGFKHVFYNVYFHLSTILSNLDEINQNIII